MSARLAPTAAFILHAAAHRKTQHGRRMTRREGLT